jgi:hypothetical protein
MIFLVYEARSGSTFLASLLNSIDEVGVTIEDSIPWGIGLIDYNFKSKDRIYRALVNDVKFKEWNIDNSIVKKIINNNSHILVNILEAYFNNKKKEINHYIYKCPIYIQCPEIIFRKFPHAKIIHIYRDPRAVYSSQKNNKISTSNKLFSTNPYTFSKVWKKAINNSFEMQTDKRFYNIEYESLINETNVTLKAIAKFIGVEYKITNKSDYYLDIPRKQKYLHKNVNNKPLENRIDAWEQILTKEEIIIIELCLGEEMVKLGYKMKCLKNDLKSKLLLLKYVIMHYIGFFSNFFRLLFKFKTLVLKLKHR